MSRPMCPICLGQNFLDYRGRLQTQCSTCHSLERHRSFKLFMLWAGPTYSNVFLTSSSNPFAHACLPDQQPNIQLLGDVDPESITEDSAKNTVVFLENKVGFKDIESHIKAKIKTLISKGSLIAFTCHTSCNDRSSALSELFEHRIDCSHFDPKNIYGSNISEHCKLSLSKNASSISDIYYFTAKSTEPVLECV